MQPQRRHNRPEPAIAMGAPPARRFSLLELVSCAEREARARRQTFPHRVSTGKMGRALAEREVALMEQIASRLKELAHHEGWGV